MSIASNETSLKCVSVDLERIHETWEVLWKEYGRNFRKQFGHLPSHSLSVKCKKCFHDWRVSGANSKTEPLVWPPDLVDKSCPVCGTKLPEASIKL